MRREYKLDGTKDRAEEGDDRPLRDKIMSCPCGRGDYGLCQDCPYDFCSVHGTSRQAVS